MAETNGKATVAVIGAGMAGTEAAATIARYGHPVDLYEMKPKKFSPAHANPGFAELVCSNSLGAEGDETAPGLLKHEMAELGSVVLKAAEASRVPAGRALGVDRDKFSAAVTAEIEREGLIHIHRDECVEIPSHDLVIVATGPLTSDSLAADLARRVGQETLYFYDSISP